MSNEKVTIGMEIIFFRHILDNPEQFEKVPVDVFKTNEDIQFVYKIVRDEYLLSGKKSVPSPQQIVTMVKLHSNVHTISDEHLKALLKHNNDKYEKDFVESRFKAWKLSFTIRNHVFESADMIRSIDVLDYTNVASFAAKIKSIISDVDIIGDDNIDIGSDFDDPLSHVQDHTVQKISTGWVGIDEILNGGWDYSSLSVVVGPTNCGKCCSYDTSIKIRNKSNGEIINISIGDFYKMIKNK